MKHWAALAVIQNHAVNPLSPFIVNGALAVLSASLAFVSALALNSRKNAHDAVLKAQKDAEEVNKRVTDLESKLALVNAAVVPISTAFQAILIKELTHYHTPEMDALLVKIGPPNTLDVQESTILYRMLEERTRDLGSEITPSEREAAYILPAVMKRAQIEQRTLSMAEDMKLKLITIAEVIGIPTMLNKEK